MPDFTRLAARSGEIVSPGMGEASIKTCRGLERVYNEIGRDLSANLLTISIDNTPSPLTTGWLTGTTRCRWNLALALPRLLRPQIRSFPVYAARALPLPSVVS